MKTYNSIYKRLMVFCCFLSALVLSANAQWDVRNLNLVIVLVGIWEFLLHFIQTINMWKDRHCSFRLLKV